MFKRTRSVSMENSKLEVKKFILNDLQKNGVISLSPTEMEELVSDENGFMPRLTAAFSNIFKPTNRLLFFGILALSGGAVWSLYNNRGRNLLKI